jgi:hypothetical protein
MSTTRPAEALLPAMVTKRASSSHLWLVREQRVRWGLAAMYALFGGLLVFDVVGYNGGAGAWLSWAIAVRVGLAAAGLVLLAAEVCCPALGRGWWDALRCAVCMGMVVFEVVALGHAQSLGGAHWARGRANVDLAVLILLNLVCCALLPVRRLHAVSREGGAAWCTGTCRGSPVAVGVQFFGHCCGGRPLRPWAPTDRTAVQRFPPTPLCAKD